MANLKHIYSVIIGANPDYIYFRVPKVGSSSLRKLLNEHTTVKHDAYSRRTPPEDMAGHFTFAFVRNPYNRLVSTWHDKVLQTETDEKKHYQSCFNKDFDFFVNFVCTRYADSRKAEGHVRPQAYFIPDTIDFVGRLENFTEDMRHVTRQLGLDAPDIPHLKAWPRPHYSTYYTAETFARVQAYYRDDLERFGYAFETPEDDPATPAAGS